MRDVAKFWLVIVGDVIRNFIRDDCSFLAAGIAFYAFFSLFPLCLLCITFIGWAVSIPWIHQQVLAVTQGGMANGSGLEAGAFTYTVQLIQSLMPTASTWIEEELLIIADHIGSNVFIGVVLGLWSGRLLYMAMEYSLHRCWGIPNLRGWLKSSLVSMYLVMVSFVVGTILLFFMGALTLIQSVLSNFPLPTMLGFSLDQAVLWGWLVSWVAIPLCVSALFLMMYRLLPAERLPVRYLMPGALFSGIAWKVSSYCYVFYGLRFGSISALYGSIWYIVGLLTWLYVVAFVFLIGAEIVYAYAYQQELVTGQRILPLKV